MNIKKFFTKRIVLSLVLLSAGIGLATTLTDEFEITKNLEIYSNIFRDLNVYYVDEVDPEQMMENGLDAMLESLDPYTSYIPAEEVDRFKSTITGRYAGLGASIIHSTEYVTIAEVYENSPAFKAGLRAGDQMKSADGTEMKNLSVQEVSNLMRGEPGSEVNAEILRDGEVLKMKFIREEVKLKNVPYYGLLANDYGYIALSAFTQQAGKNVKTALLELKNQKRLKGVVLDLRGNTGGLLTEAVNVVNVFVDRGQPVVTIKGRVKEKQQVFKTLNAAVDAQLPLIVLIDNVSASASEIVAGAIQDMDRGIIVGRKSFGKGLVQNTVDLPYGAKLKLTTARYYIPSGRCIQALKYEDGLPVQIADSLREAFKTVGGRIVYDGGGITPDLENEEKTYRKILATLRKDRLLFNYTVNYCNKIKNKPDPEKFRLTDKDFDAFLKYLEEQNYDYSTATESALKEMEKKSIAEGYHDALKDEIVKMQKALKQDKLDLLKSVKEQLLHQLQFQIALNLYLENVALKTTVQDDADVQKALELLQDKATYRQTLSKK